MSEIDEGRHRILIVDDNRAIHQDFRKILLSDDTSELDALESAFFEEDAPERRASFEVDSAYQGKEGYDLVVQALAEGRPYALAFVDMRMPPGWDGLETIDKIWREDPDLHTVICTAYSDHTWGEIVERLGRSDRLLILKKPFDNVEIEQIAYALSQKWQLHRSARVRLNELEETVSRLTRERREEKAELRKQSHEDLALELDISEWSSEAANSAARAVERLELALAAAEALGGESGDAHARDVAPVEQHGRLIGLIRSTLEELRSGADASGAHGSSVPDRDAA